MERYLSAILGVPPTTLILTNLRGQPWRSSVDPHDWTLIVRMVERGGMQRSRSQQRTVSTTVPCDIDDDEESEEVRMARQRDMVEAAHDGREDWGDAGVKTLDKERHRP